MTAALRDRVVELEAVVARQAVALARLEAGAARAIDADPLRGLNPIKRRVVSLVIETVATTFRVDGDDVVGASLERGFIQPRFAAVWLVRRLTDLTLPRIAPLFGYIDVSSVCHALRRADGWRETDADFARVTDAIAERIAAERVEWRP